MKNTMTYNERVKNILLFFERAGYSASIDTPVAIENNQPVSLRDALLKEEYSCDGEPENYRYAVYQMRLFDFEEVLDAVSDTQRLKAYLATNQNNLKGSSIVSPELKRMILEHQIDESIVFAQRLYFCVEKNYRKQILCIGD